MPWFGKGSYVTCPFLGPGANERCNVNCRFYLDESKGCWVSVGLVALVSLSESLARLQESYEKHAGGF